MSDDQENVSFKFLYYCRITHIYESIFFVFFVSKNLMDFPAENQNNTIFRILKTKTKHHSTFIERFWARQRQNLSLYRRLNNASRTTSTSMSTNQNATTTDTILPTDIQLHCLDANSLVLLHDRNNYYYNNFRPESVTGCDSASLVDSSLDLEWEHEYGSSKQQASWLSLEEDLSSVSDSDDNYSSSEFSRNSSSNKPNCNNNKSNNNSMYSLRNSIQHSSRCDLLRTKRKNGKPSKSNTSWSHISTPESLEWDVHEDDQKFKSEEDLLDQETMELLQEIEWLKNRALNETGETVQWDNREQES